MFSDQELTVLARDKPVTADALRHLVSAEKVALRLAASIGEAWQHAAPERREAFLEEWFEEIRLHDDDASR